MAVIYKLAIVATAALAMVSAAPVNARHTTATEIPASEIPAASEPIISIAGSTYSGRGTWFTDTTGSCDIPFNTNDLIVAMNAAMMGGTAQCGRTVRVEHGGKSVTARVADTCPSQFCSSTSLDLSQAVFKQLAPLEAGEIDIQWSFV
ncbi:hypothetical protein BGZ93_009101 [Podila epicladia]|nr:hypothetical protein BGZ92_010876 [Podila epicladia]KAG0099124.1 hypothetical protein BGZ93_009101 [Podila epicladia]